MCVRAASEISERALACDPLSSPLARARSGLRCEDCCLHADVRVGLPQAVAHTPRSDHSRAKGQSPAAACASAMERAVAPSQHGSSRLQLSTYDSSRLEYSDVAGVPARSSSSAETAEGNGRKATHRMSEVIRRD